MKKMKKKCLPTIYLKTEAIKFSFVRAYKLKKLIFAQHEFVLKRVSTTDSIEVYKAIKEG